MFDSRGFIPSATAFLVCLFLYSALPAPLWGQSRLTGRVIDPSGAAIAGAVVSVEDSQGQPVYTGTTGPDGRFVFTGVTLGVYAVVAEAQGFATTREQVRVSGEETTVEVRMELGGVAEEITVTANQYGVETTTAATKTSAPLHETPQAVDVLTRTLIEEQGSLELSQALRNVPSVGRIANEGNVAGQEDVTIRGFQTNRVFKNGFQYNNGNGPIMLANVETVQVVKGPASMIYGAISPGGIVNIVTGKPQSAPAYELEFEANEFGLVEPTVDLTGPLTPGGNLAYRLTASHREGDVFIDDNRIERTLVNPALHWRPNEKSNVDFNFDYTRDDSTFQFGIPFRDGRPDPRIPVDRFLGEDFNDKENDDVLLQVGGDYRPARKWTLQIDGGWHRYEHRSSALRPAGSEVEEDGTFDRFFSLRSGNILDEFQYDGLATYESAWGATRHTVTAGVQYRRTDNDSTSPTGNLFSDDLAVDVFNPTRGVIGPGSTDDPNFVDFGMTDGDSEQWTAFIQDDVWLTRKLKALVSLGFTDIEQSTLFPSFDIDAQNDGDQFTPRFGLLYQPASDTSLYTSYSRSLEPSFGANPDGVAFDPTEGEQWEVGLKQRFLNGRFVLTFSFFDLEQTNLTEPDPERPGFQRQVGAIGSTGVEVTGRGQLPGDLLLSFSFAALDNEVLTEGNPNRGNRSSNVPEEEMSLWLTKGFTNRSMGRFRIGAGLFAEGERFVTSGNDRVLPGYGTVDLGFWFTPAGLGENVTFQANLMNVFDKRYFESGFFRVAMPGQPRTFIGKVAWRF